MTDDSATPTGLLHASILTRRTALAQRLAQAITHSGAEPKVHTTPAAALAWFSGPACAILDASDEANLDLIVELRQQQRQVPVLVIIPAKVPGQAAWLSLIGHPVVGVVREPLDEKALATQLREALETAEKWWAQDQMLADYRARLASLTARERQILLLIVAGRLNKQIAADLGIAGRTVEIHRGRVLNKLDAGNIAEAARILIFAHPNWINTPAPSPAHRPGESALVTAI